MDPAMKRPKATDPIRARKTKRLRDYIAPQFKAPAPPSFDTIKADLLRQKARKTLWAFQEIKSLYDTHQISQEEYFKMFADLEPLGRRTTEEIQDLLEACVAARRYRYQKANTRSKAVTALRRAYPDEPIEEIFACVKAQFPDT